MESLVTFLLVLIISAIATMIKKVAQKQSDQSSDPTRNTPSGQQRPTALPQRKVVNWEDELRRLLGDEGPLVPPRPAPPRPPVASTRPAVPAPVIQTARPVQPARSAAPPVVQAVAPVAKKVSDLPAPSLERNVAEKEQKLLAEARQAHERAAQLHKQATEYVKKASAPPMATTKVVVKEPSVEVTQALALIKNARAARQAIVTSIILGPPKALDMSDGALQ